ncbi:MAG: murein hydrolase activator EnvC family protein [Egibacteraceae bacterium]
MTVAITLVFGCVLAVAGPVGGPAAHAAPRPQPSERLEKVQQKLKRAQTGLEDVTQRSSATLADLQTVDARRNLLAGELAELGDELSQAQRGLATVQRTVAGANAALLENERRALATRSKLDQRTQNASARARPAPELRGQGYATIVLGARSFTELARSVDYLETVLEADRVAVTEAAEGQHRLAATEAVLARLRDRHAKQRQLAATEEARVRALVDERTALRAQADASARARREVLRSIEGDRESYRQLVAELQATEERLQEELRTRIRTAPGGPAAVPMAASGRFFHPIPGMTDSNFGWRVHPIFGTRRFHAGMDTGAPTGTPIHAAQSGVVYSAGSLGGYGNAVILDHGGGLTTLYAHQSQVAVSAGQTVARGEVIGYVGSTGYSTGPHLHFEVRVGGEAREPLEWL